MAWSRCLSGLLIHAGNLEGHELLTVLVVDLIVGVRHVFVPG